MRRKFDYRLSELSNVMGSKRLVVPLCPRSFRWVVVVGVTIAIVILSLVPPPADIQSAGQSDKILHFLAYFGLAGTLTYATIELRSRPQRRSLFIFVGAVGTSLGVELLQGALPYRYFTLGDLLANALGAGLMLLWLPIEQYVEYVSLAECLDITSR